MIEFAGIRSDECYVIVEHYPQRYFPKRKYNAQAIPGGEKDFLMYEGEDAFSNYSQPYSVFLDSKGPGLSQASRRIAEWLLGHPGYQRLEDSYDPDFYRLAYYSGGEQFVNYFNEYGQGTLTFTCAPKRFYKTGEVPITLAKGQKLFSPSLFRAYPIVTFTGNGTCTITVTDSKNVSRVFTVNNVSGTITVYSREHKALTSAGVNKNSDVASDYENLYLDTESTITWNNAISSVVLTPRWWTI